MACNYTMCVQVARRCWSGNKLADATVRDAMADDDMLHVTLPHEADTTVDSIIDSALTALQTPQR